MPTTILRAVPAPRRVSPPSFFVFVLMIWALSVAVFVGGHMEAGDADLAPASDVASP